MSYQRISLGDPILLRLQTGDGDTTQFPLATVLASNHAPVSGSPFALTSIGNGLYASEAFTPGSTDHYDASYTVYSDSGHTLVNGTYNYATDSFDVYVLGSGGGGGTSISGCPITGTVVNPTMTVQVSNQPQLVAQVVNPTITAIVTDPEEIKC
jgi:hypothetical protein